MSEGVRVAAVGGTRTVPAPDPIARDYLLLGLRLGQQVEGLVDGYFGPADLKGQADTEQLRPPAQLRDDAVALRERVASEVVEQDRRGWLSAQARALEAQAASLAGDGLPYLEHVEACFDWRPWRRDEQVFHDAALALEAHLPGQGSVGERLAAWDQALAIPVDRVADVATWLAGRFRARAEALVGLPARESVRIRMVRDRPWSGYNWYDGGGRSRVEVNLDLPVRAPDLVRLVAHETYPGHHTEHAWKEAALVETTGRLEASILLINTPECLISEGLADLALDLVAPPVERADLYAELFARAGVPAGGVGGPGEPGAVREAAARQAAERAVQIVEARRRLGEASVNAALMRHVDGATHEDVAGWLRDFALMTPERAEKTLEFIEHPLWRTYVSVYSEGEALLRRWLEAVSPAERPARFGQLLREQLTPSAIATELPAAD